MTSKITTPYANSVFEQPWWLDIVAPGKWSEVIVYDESKAIARLPFVFNRGHIVMPHYTQTLGIWIDNQYRTRKRGNAQLSKQKDIIHQLVDQLPIKNGINITLDSVQDYVLPFRWEGFSIHPTFSYRIPLNHNYDDLLKYFSKSVTRDINRGERLLFVEESTSIEDFIKLQNCTYNRQQRDNPIKNSFTYEVIKKAIEFEHGKLFLAKDIDGKLHAGSFVLFDENVSYHLMSGQDVSYGNDCAMPLLLKNEIEFALEHSKAFDFEGSMIEGIEQTYRRYGGLLVTNWNVCKQSLFADFVCVAKPTLKKIIGYKN